MVEVVYLPSFSLHGRGGVYSFPLYGRGVPTKFLLYICHISNLRIKRCSCLSLCKRLYRICQPEAASGPIDRVISIPDSHYTFTTVRTTGLSGNKGCISSIVLTEGIPPVSFKSCGKNSELGICWLRQPIIPKPYWSLYIPYAGFYSRHFIFTNFTKTAWFVKI